MIHLIKSHLRLHKSFKSKAATTHSPETHVIVAMGIKGLSKLISTYAPRAMKEVDPKKYTGRLIAIDASVMIYQYLVRSDAFLFTR